MIVGKLLAYIKDKYIPYDTIITISDAKGNNPCEADPSYLVGDDTLEGFDDGSLHFWGR